jgi:hypothetical protein
LAAASSLPCVLNRVGEHGFAFGGNLNGKLNGVAVELGVACGLLLYLPIIAAIEMLQNIDVDGLRLWLESHNAQSGTASPFLSTINM